MKVKYYKKLISVNKPLECEVVNEELVFVLTNKIVNDGKFIEPIIIDKSTNLVLNGHHRLESCKRLKLKKIPCIVVDYKYRVSVTTFLRNIEVDKKSLMKMKLPFKTVNFPDLISLLNEIPTKDKYSSINLSDLK